MGRTWDKERKDTVVAVTIAMGAAAEWELDDSKRTDSVLYSTYTAEERLADIQE